MNVRRLLLLTDDEFLAESLGLYMRRDVIEVERVTSADDAASRIASAAAADGVLVDLAKRGISGDAIMTLSSRARRWKIPMLVMSTQPRRDLTDFAAVICATDVISKSESMPAIAARIRMCMRTRLRPQQKESLPAISRHLELATA